MSTRSMIGMVDKFGFINVIYCHSEGEIEYNGAVLNKYYRDENKVAELISLGNLRYISMTPELCFAYHRDRRDDWNTCAPVVLKNRVEAQNYWSKCVCIEYIYLYKNGMWYYKQGGGKRFLKLEPYLRKNNLDNKTLNEQEERNIYLTQMEIVAKQLNKFNI